MDLHTMALNGDAAGIITLLKSEPTLVNFRAYGKTALHHACHRGHHDAVRALLICGADPNFRDANNQETPLHVACANNFPRVAELLCSRGAKVNLPDGHYQWTALHHAAERGALQTICALLDTEPSARSGYIQIDVRDIDGFTPLHHAAINGFPDVASALIDRGADPHSQAGQQPIVSVSSGPDMQGGGPESMSQTPIRQSCHHSQPQTVDTI